MYLKFKNQFTPTIYFHFSLMDCINYQIKYKKSISHKPDSVTIENNSGYHLSSCVITNTILLPTLQRIISDLNEPLYGADLRGITAHKVYP